VTKAPYGPCGSCQETTKLHISKEATRELRNIETNQLL